MYLVGLHIYYKIIHGPYNIKLNIRTYEYMRFLNKYQTTFTASHFISELTVSAGYIRNSKTSTISVNPLTFNGLKIAIRPNLNKSNL